MKTNPKLRECLRDEDPKLARMADELWSKVQPIHERSNLPDSHENGLEHALAVENNVWRLIKDSGHIPDFSPTEICLLSCAACCHDLDKGLKSALPGDPDHGKGSQEYVENSKDLNSVLTKRWRYAIGPIIGVHNLKTQDFLRIVNNIDTEYTIDETINLQPLAIILKAGDILHSDASRVPLVGCDPDELSCDDEMKRRARNCISGWQISGATIILKAKATNDDEEKSVRRCHSLTCRDDWAGVEAHLDDMHFPHLLDLHLEQDNKDHVMVKYWETQSRHALFKEKTAKLLFRYRGTEDIVLRTLIAQEIINRADKLHEQGRSEASIVLNRNIATLLENEEVTTLRNCRSDALYNLSTAFTAKWHRTKDDAILQEAFDLSRKSIELGNRTYNYACILALQNKTEEAFEELRGCLERGEISWAYVDEGHPDNDDLPDPDWDHLRNDPRYHELRRRWGMESEVSPRTISGAVEMRPSKYNVHIPMEGAQVLIFNTFSDSRVIVDTSALETMETCNKGGHLNDDQKEQIRQLKALGFVVDDCADEDREVEYWFQRAKYDSSIMTATILTTLACNMQCIYCFEQGVQTSSSMNKETVDKTCSWITERMDEVRPHELVITSWSSHSSEGNLY